MTDSSEGDERMRKLVNFIFDIFEVYLAVIVFSALIISIFLEVRVV